MTVFSDNGGKSSNNNSNKFLAYKVCSCSLLKTRELCLGKLFSDNRN